jgi:hypothetical protein
MYSLFYLANPIYGGWVTFTAHLALKHKLPVFEIGNKTETKERDFGYGVTYKNVSSSDIAGHSENIVITAVDPNHYQYLSQFPNGTFIVIHDPSEVTKKTSDELIENLRRFKIVTIRKSVTNYLQKEFDLSSKFILHPFYEYDREERNPAASNAVSISRIDFDKHTDIILKANKLIKSKADRIQLWGFANLRYVFFKLAGLNFESFYRGRFPKSFEALNNVLKDSKWVVDMSVIKHDGGGTQYTFLEAIYNECALVINKRWVEGFATPFINGKNCFVVGSAEELAELLTDDPAVAGVLKEAKKILEPHTRVNWLTQLNAYKKAGSRKTRRVKRSQ